MKTTFKIMMVVAAILLGCGEYDDSAIKSDISDLKSRVAVLEQQCRNINENLSSLQAIVAAVQNRDGIVSVTDLPNNAGYAVLFTSGKTIYLRNGANGTDGKNGADGQAPKISVKLDSDGCYYWTIDGEWLVVDGKKVKAVGTDGKDGADGKDGEDGADGKDGSDGTNGKDGITPQLKIEEDGFWYVTYDNGTTWSKLGKAVGDNGKDGEDGNDGTDGKDGKDGDNFFKSVTIDGGYVIFVLNDGDQTTIKVPMEGTATVSSIKYVPESLEGVIKVKYFMLRDDPVPENVEVRFEVLPQDAVDYIVKNWKDVLVAKAVYVSSTRAEIGDFVTLGINDVVECKDNMLIITLDTDSLDKVFFSTDTSAGACLRLFVKINGSESVSSGYLPMVPLLSKDGTDGSQELIPIVEENVDFNER